MKAEADMDAYIPPYDITDEMLELTSEIMEQLGRLGILIRLCPDKSACPDSSCRSGRNGSSRHSTGKSEQDCPGTFIAHP